MNNVGVLKTKNESAIFNIRLSWFIYTPTENLRLVKKIRTFWYFILTLPNIAPNIVKPQKKSILSPITQPNFQPTIQTIFFLYKYKNPKKIHTFTDCQFFTKNYIKITTHLTTPLIASNLNFNIIPYQDIKKYILPT